MHKITLVLSALLSMASLPVNATITDSEQFLKLLSDAKTEASLLQKDAAELNAFSHSNISWQSYADKLTEIKTHANEVALIVQQLNDLRIIASPWQRIAIDRVNPILQELAENTQLTITKLNSHPNHVHMPPYTDYVAGQYDLATQLASLIGNFVEYGKTKAKLETLTWKLELPER